MPSWKAWVQRPRGLIKMREEHYESLNVVVYTFKIS